MRPSQTSTEKVSLTSAAPINLETERVMMTEPESIEKRQRFIMLKDKDAYVEGKDLDGISNPSPSLSNILISPRLLNSPPKFQQKK